MVRWQGLLRWRVIMRWFLSVRAVLLVKVAGDQHECLSEEVEVDFSAGGAANGDARWSRFLSGGVGGVVPPLAVGRVVLLSSSGVCPRGRPWGGCAYACRRARGADVRADERSWLGIAGAPAASGDLDGAPVGGVVLQSVIDPGAAHAGRRHEIRDRTALQGGLP